MILRRQKQNASALRNQLERVAAFATLLGGRVYDTQNNLRYDLDPAVSELSADVILQHLPVQCQVFDNLLEPIVLDLERLQAAHLIRQPPPIALLPIELGRLIYASLATDLRNRRAFIALLQDERFLRLRKSRCLPCFHSSATRKA